MSDSISRRDWLMAMGAVGAGSLLPPAPSSGLPTPPILPLTSTSDVFVPPRGRAFMKFSFDFPEPSVEFAGLRFSFLVFTRENAYALDASAMAAEGSGDALTLTSARLTSAGGQLKAEGRVEGGHPARQAVGGRWRAVRSQGRRGALGLSVRRRRSLGRQHGMGTRHTGHRSARQRRGVHRALVARRSRAREAVLLSARRAGLQSRAGA